MRIPNGQILAGFVLRSALGDCTAGGVTSRERVFDLVEDGAEVPERLRATTLRVVRRDIGGEYIHAEPFEPCPADRIGYMAGGSYVVSSDDRWQQWIGTPYPIPVHDRSDSPEVYEMLSR